MSSFAEAFKEVEGNIKAQNEEVDLFVVNCACVTNARSWFRGLVASVALLRRQRKGKGMRVYVLVPFNDDNSSELYVKIQFVPHSKHTISQSQVYFRRVIRKRCTFNNRYNCCDTMCSRGLLISPQPDLLPDVFCLMVRIFRLMLVLLYI